MMSDQFSPVLDIPAHAPTERTLARLPCLVTETRLRTENELHLGPSQHSLLLLVTITSRLHLNEV